MIVNDRVIAIYIDRDHKVIEYHSVLHQVRETIFYCSMCSIFGATLDFILSMLQRFLNLYHCSTQNRVFGPFGRGSLKSFREDCERNIL